MNGGDITRKPACHAQWPRDKHCHVAAGAGAKAAAAQVVLDGYDGHVTTVRLANFGGDYRLRVPRHGAINPRGTLWQSARWLTAIGCVAADHPNLRATRGDRAVAERWPEARCR